MSDECVDCRSTILNAQTSNIAVPQCQDDCPQDVDCEGIITSSDCITVNTALDCSDTSVGDILTDVLEAMDDKICEATASTCTAKVDAGDTCCGYLFDKFTSTSLEITKVGTTCKTLNIEEKCWCWNNITTPSSSDGSFKYKWENADNSSQVGQYSNEKECVIKLRGVIKNESYDASTNLIFVLPIGKRPFKDRLFSVNVIENPSFAGNILPGFIRIYAATGQVVLLYNESSSALTHVVTTLDGISFEIGENC